MEEERPPTYDVEEISLEEAVEIIAAVSNELINNQLCYELL